MTVLDTVFNSSPYMEKYVLESLYMMGEPEAAYARMKKRYGPLVDNELTTLPELWDPNWGSKNHAWTGGPLTFMGSYMAGLKPLTPGWKVFEVRPNLAHLDWLETTVPSISGDISLRLDRREGGFSIKLDVPEGTRAVVWLPNETETGELQVVGRNEDGFAVIVDAGHWEF